MSRETALAWWRDLTEEQRKAFCEHHGKDKAIVGATGFQIEDLWNLMGNPKSFKDFPPDELVGKSVVYRSGQTNVSHSSFFKKIERVTKTGFRIEGVTGLFDFNGERKWLSDRSDWSTISECQLITEEEKVVIARMWKAKKEMKQLKEDIITQVERTGFAASTLEQLEAAATALGLVKM